MQNNTVKQLRGKCLEHAWWNMSILIVTVKDNEQSTHLQVYSMLCVENLCVGVFGCGSSRSFQEIFCWRKNFLFGKTVYTSTIAQGSEYDTSSAWSAGDNSSSGWVKPRWFDWFIYFCSKVVDIVISSLSILLEELQTCFAVVQKATDSFLHSYFFHERCQQLKTSIQDSWAYHVSYINNTVHVTNTIKLITEFISTVMQWKQWKTMFSMF